MKCFLYFQSDWFLISFSIVLRSIDIFVERKRRIETSPMVCHCVRPPPGSGRIGCGEDCYNRVMFYECIPSLCPCGDQCSNQRFQHKHNEDNLRVIWVRSIKLARDQELYPIPRLLSIFFLLFTLFCRLPNVDSEFRLWSQSRRGAL